MAIEKRENFFTLKRLKEFDREVKKI